MVKAAELPAGGAPGGDDALHVGPRGALLQGLQEALQGVSGALGDDLHPAPVRGVAHVAGEAQGAGPVLHEEAEADPLHPPLHLGLEAVPGLLGPPGLLAPAPPLRGPGGGGAPRAVHAPHCTAPCL